MNENFNKDVAKYVRQKPLDQILTPGSTGRRYEPVGGLKSHRDRIHRESEQADAKNLDFAFKKPHKPIGRPAVVSCDNCGYILSGTTATAGIICPKCKQFSTVSEVAEDE